MKNLALKNLNTNKDKNTHQVAVNAYLIFEDKFLLLKRTKPPIIWGPPGGRLHQNEDPLQGLYREVHEETQLTVNIIRPVTTWFGEFRGTQLLSIDYLCTSEKDGILLSREHKDFKWITFTDLEKNATKFLKSTIGFQFADFYSAWQIYLLHTKRLK
jgi:ADP-ribose pyrophosphatase YjhB (NUDIX family)